MQSRLSKHEQLVPSSYVKTYNGIAPPVMTGSARAGTQSMEMTGFAATAVDDE